MRNDLYVTLEKGEFEKGGKTVARNVEITVYALDADGQILRVFSFTLPLVKILHVNPSVVYVLLVFIELISISLQYQNHATVQQI